MAGGALEENAADLDAVDMTPDLGPGPPSVFGQTVTADADKIAVRWPIATAFEAVRGSFVSSATLGTYRVGATWSGNGTSFTDPSMPITGAGYWYLVKLGGCVRSSWQSLPGLEPGRDAAIP